MQPWASAFFYLPDPKDIENRHWPTSHRGRLYIHAGRKHDEDAPQWAFDAAPEPLRGYILGYVTLWRCVSPQERRTMRPPRSKWAVTGNDVYHWYVAHPVALEEPVRTRGYQGIWKIPDEIAAHL
jgi:hypothetical protein